MPSAASRSAMARPMPELAPVMMAVLSVVMPIECPAGSVLIQD